MRTYRSFCFSTEPNWELVPAADIDCFLWETGDVFRPKSAFQLCFWEKKGVCARFWSDEANPRAVCENRDEPVYEDSCLELFFSPDLRAGYLNLEMNPRGVFLAEFGKARENRVSVSALTALSPIVTPLQTETGWGVECFVPCELLEALFGMPFAAQPGVFRGNFYKCGDKTSVPHYAAFSPVGTLPPGFHDPEHFAVIEIRRWRDGIAEENH